MRRIFTNAIKQMLNNNIVKNETTLPLGRWKLDSEKNKSIKSIMANYDSCGDKLCGDPKNLKSILDNEHKK